jgi:hypothetical protein
MDTDESCLQEGKEKLIKTQRSAHYARQVRKQKVEIGVNCL